SAYPKMIEQELRVVSSEGTRDLMHERKVLVRFEPGTGAPIGWGTPSSAAIATPERSPGAPVPTDGAAAPVAYRLSQAMVDAQADPRLLPFQQWLRAHPQARLVAFQLHRGDYDQAQAPSLQWRLGWATSSGEGYAVQLERHAITTALPSYVRDG